ncbi:MAG: HNH endonuclease [Chloroflexi bacterium HGW-Chloroflexi-6]|nr:MAG: HNH endonuclease [Chloroflexi bacterium HGW-Chloroflexi-6]
MLAIPSSQHLPVQYLAAGFNEVTNSYKFYWFLAILEEIQEKRSPCLATRDLLARMVAGVWYPTNYFRLSFGKQDRLGQAAVQLGADANLLMDASRQKIIQHLIAIDLPRDIKSLGAYVPYRFLRPFFALQLRGLTDAKVNGQIQQLANAAFTNEQNPCLYRFSRGGIEIHPTWFEYLNQHLSILTAFCLWHLVNYLQKNNPNVPNVSGKLFEPVQRDLKQAKAVWMTVLDVAGPLICIYSGQPLQKGAFSLDHFLPWRFVAHDLLWNIIPTPKSVNSSKNDSLPDLSRYFEKFADAQYLAVQAVAKSSRPALLEDYALLLKSESIAELRTISKARFRDQLQAVITPQVQIATNMGFSGEWVFAP